MVPFFVCVAAEGLQGWTTMREALMRLLEPPIEALGFELVDIEFAQAGRGGVLRHLHRRGARGRCGRAASRSRTAPR